MRKSSLLASGLALTVGAPAAHADPLSDQAFLKDLQAIGMSFNVSDDRVLAMGHAVCADMDHGLTYEQLEQKIMASGAGWRPNETNNFAWTAVTDLCPTHKPPVPTPKPGGPGLDPNWPPGPGQ
jgi:uncharacterized protein DUF732